MDIYTGLGNAWGAKRCHLFPKHKMKMINLPRTHCTFYILHGYATLGSHWPTTKQVRLNNVTGSIAFSAASPDPFTSVACAQAELALICEKHQWWISINGEDRGRPALRSPRDVSFCLVRDIHTSVFCWRSICSSGSAHSVPPYIKEQIPVLLMG